jgi:hypothetical protein
VQHTGKLDVGPVLGRANDFIDTVVTYRPGADDIVLAGFR